MENKKTIEYLNAKWWYRLLKVSFIGFTFIISISSFFIIIDDNAPEKDKDYKINCIADYTNKESFFAEKDADIYIYKYDTDTLYQSLSTDDKTKIRQKCDISDEEADIATQKALTYIKEAENLGTNKVTIQRYIDINLRPYLISEQYVTKGSYLIGIIYSLLAIILILIVMETIRRIFYYIVLGSFLPEKPKKYLGIKIKKNQ